MGRLIFDGDTKYLRAIVKTQKARVGKYNLKVSLEEDKQEVKTPLANQKTATETADIIAKIESSEDLKQYKNDTRQVVAAAYKKKLKEFE